VTIRRGPKSIPDGAPLALGSLPKDGGDRAIAFIESYCRLPKGGKGNPAGAKLRLRPWQREIICGLFDDPRPRQGLVSVARKNGKTLLAACIGLYALLGDGEESAEVIVVSVNEQTARVCYNLARRMVELDDRLSGIVQVFQDRIYHPASDSVLEFLPGTGRLLQGRNPSLAIVDEVHVCDGDAWDSMALAGGTRAHPLVLGISTETDDQPDQLMARLVSHGRAGTDKDFYFREFTAPAGCELTDQAAWAASNPMLGDTLDPAHLAALVRTTRESRFRRFHLNQRMSLDGAWLPAGAWASCAVPFRIPDGVEVVLGFDGSYNDDCTVIVCVTVDPERPHIEIVEVWQPGAGDQVPIDAVEDALREACKRWSVLEIAADAYRWARSLQILAGEGLPVLEFPQTTARMTPATAAFEQAVLNGRLTHSGDKTLAEHVGNVVIKDDGRGARLAKPSKHSPRRIDAAVAAVMAYSRAAYLAESSGVSLFAFELE
jgi:phage terminase large subunit-like protein